MNTEKCFTNCCHNGKFLFNSDDSYLEQLKQLMISDTKDSKNFMNNIRIYNNLLAFASFGAKLVTFPIAIIYPLLFPRGECGWYPNLTCFD